MNQEIHHYLQVQNIALRVLNEAVHFIQPGVTEKDISEECIKLLKKEGIHDCWYHGVPAYILVGERSTLSMSGRNYKPTDIQVQPGDLVTVDLSPVMNGYWGDCTRSYIIGDQRLEHGISAEKKLHSIMREIASPKMTMHELYIVMNAKIKKLGYENLDFKANLGHSIEKEINQRRYIELDNITPLGDVMLFTFEPHIRKTGSTHGFKRENIYYFENEKPVPLGNPELLDLL